MIEAWKKMNFRSKILVSMLIYLAFLTQECLIMQCTTGLEPTTIIVSSFAAFSVQGGASAFIEKLHFDKPKKTKEVK